MFDLLSLFSVLHPHLSIPVCRRSPDIDWLLGDFGDEMSTHPKPRLSYTHKCRTASKVHSTGEVVLWKWKRINAKIAEKLSERT